MQRLVGKLGDNVVRLSQKVFACVLVKFLNRGSVAFHHRARGVLAGRGGQFLQKPFGHGDAVRAQDAFEGCQRVGAQSSVCLGWSGGHAISEPC